jgi:hypothetical protein
VATTEVAKPDARLVLPGGASRPAQIEVLFLPRATRLWRALLILGVAVVVAPVVFFLPPHFLWPLVVLGGAAFIAHRYWTREYYVLAFEGSCPRCEEPLEVKQGARIRGRHTLECYGCHRQPELILDDPEADDE